MPAESDRWVGTTLQLGAWALGFMVATFSTADADLWGHLRFGLDAISARGLAVVDPYSFTQDVPWTNHEWLAEVVTAAAWLAGGVTGLVLLKASVVGASFALLWRALAGASLLARLGVMAVAIAATPHMTLHVRPQLWSLFAFTVMLVALTRSTRPWWLPALFAFWANAHGGFIVGLGVLGVWAAVEVLRQPASFFRWSALVAASAAATIATPYGWHLWLFLTRTVRPSRAIQEWEPMMSQAPADWLPWLAVLVASAWLARRLTVQRAPRLAVLALLAVMSFRVMRLGSFLTVAAVVLLAPAIVERWPADRRRSSLLAGRGNIWAAAYLALLLFGGAVWIGSRTLTCLPVMSDLAPEREPVARLKTVPPGRLVVAFNWGEYAIWHLGPRLQVSVDGRRETVYSPRVLDRSFELEAGDRRGEQTLVEWNPDYVWLPSTAAPLEPWLSAHGYRIDWRGQRAFLAVRSSREAVPEPVLAAAGRRCFPD